MRLFKKLDKVQTVDESDIGDIPIGSHCTITAVENKDYTGNLVYEIEDESGNSDWIKETRLIRIIAPAPHIIPGPMVLKGLEVEYVSLSETDPDGLASSTAGAKLDSGKPLTNQILRRFSRALAAIVDLGTVGAVKYSLDGWMEVDNGQERYENARERHKLKRWAGEDIDEDTGQLHETCEVWNALAALELKLREVDV